MLRKDGTLWLDIGDTSVTKAFGNYKLKDICCVPHKVAEALRADGWYLRMDCVWNKINAMPDEGLDRPIKSHEYVFLLSKNPKYFYNRDAVRVKTGNECTWEEYNELKGTNVNAHLDRMGKGFRKHTKGITHPLGRGLRSVWDKPSVRSKIKHYSAFPLWLPELGIKAGTHENSNDVVMDIFSGTGTTGDAALALNKRYIGIELCTSHFNDSCHRLREIEYAYSENAKYK